MITREEASRIVASDNPMRAYVLVENGRYSDSHWFEGTPENIANFIMRYPENDLIITDWMDQMVCTTSMSFLDRVPDQKLCEQIKEHLIPMQMGEVEPGEVLSFTDEESELLVGQDEEQDLQQDF